MGWQGYPRHFTPNRDGGILGISPSEIQMMERGGSAVPKIRNDGLDWSEPT